MHEHNQARSASDLKRTVSAARSPTASRPVAPLNGIAMAAQHTTPPHGSGDHVGSTDTPMADSQPETGYLDRLCAELRVRGLPSEVITSSYKPRLRIDSPYAYGDFAGAEFDNVFAAAPDGHWSYWWPWVEEICAADDPVKAAEVIITGLGLDDSDGDDEDEDEDEDEAPAHGTGDNTAPGHGGVADTITTHPDDGIANGHGHCGQSAPAHSGYRNR